MANDPGTSAEEADRLRDKAQHLFATRRNLLLLFWKCVNRVWDEIREEPVCSASATASVARAIDVPSAGDEVCDASKKTLQGYVDMTLNPGNPKITIDDDFYVPDEPDVDWDKWYRDWIKLVKTEVWDPVRAHFCNDRFSYYVDMKYEVRPDHTISITFLHTEGTDDKNGENYRKSLENRFLSRIQNRVPAFPSGTKYGTPGKPLIRTFYFRHRVPGSSGMRLAGPPVE
jgi:hypothetical protein